MTVVDPARYALRPSAAGGPVRVPKGRYLDEAYAARERSHLWARTWQLACLASDVDEPG